jgi:magnesium-transporting ATPase (P-type)
MPRRRSEYGYDDEDDDLDLGGRRKRGPLPSHPTTAGMLGFIAAMVALAFLIVVAILWFALNQEELRQEIPQRTRLMYYWFLILDVLSFIAALCAIIFTSRGLSPTNPLYRGWAMLGLILGIIEIVATLIFGLIMTCNVLLFEALRGAG